ncbi:MAG: dual specificity protein phosphatase family protein [Thaumarchaeota archaeon]|nr:dual specificity protein phosphatase family protein [Nitrososphaerota archaeon]
MGRTGTAYRRIRSVVTDKPTFFGWVIEGRLAASGLPSSEGQLRWLQSHGVDSILTLRETPLPEEWVAATRLSAKHVKMLDHAPPSPEALEEATGYISAQLKDGRSVLVHCLAGVGRTGSVLAAYMIEYEGRSADDAIARLRAIRPGSVEGAQESAVRDYEKTVRRAKR